MNNSLTDMVSMEFITLTQNLMHWAWNVWDLDVCCAVSRYGGTHSGVHSDLNKSELLFYSQHKNCGHRKLYKDLTAETTDAFNRIELNNSIIYLFTVKNVMIGGFGIQSNSVSLSSKITREVVKKFRSYLQRYYLFERSKDIFGKDHPLRIIGEDQVLEKSLNDIVNYAHSDMPVLILGETGTGKELLAKALHLSSERINNPFVPVNCSQLLNDRLALSSLFGHSKGSFTGALNDRDGYFQQADGGTIFLDEVETLSPHMQSTLLRTVESGEIQRVGKNSQEAVKVKLVAASNVDIESMIHQGEFRRDFFYRISGHIVEIPPLRERIVNDIYLLADYYLQECIQQTGLEKQFDKDCFGVLKNYQWPGNIRQLKNSIYSAFYKCGNRETIYPEDFAANLKTGLDEIPKDGKVTVSDTIYQELLSGSASFWELVRNPFLKRDLNRKQVRRIIQKGLERSSSYKELLSAFNMEQKEYKKFVDFLRHHKLST